MLQHFQKYFVFSPNERGNIFSLRCDTHFVFVYRASIGPDYGLQIRPKHVAILNLQKIYCYV